MEEVLTAQADKMRDLRLHMLGTLEAYISRDELSIWEATRFFMRATCMPYNEAQIYLRDMSSEDSIFRTHTLPLMAPKQAKI